MSHDRFQPPLLLPLPFSCGKVDHFDDHFGMVKSCDFVSHGHQGNIAIFPCYQGNIADIPLAVPLKFDCAMVQAANTETTSRNAKFLINYHY